MNDPRAALARPLAAVTTATVDVQVLRIGAKQMTLAVFRQLHRDDAFDGPMWGTVNYCHRLFDWPCDPKNPDWHQHIVWQDGNELRHGIRRTLYGLSASQFKLGVRLADRFGGRCRYDHPPRGYDAQEVVDHAGTFHPDELQRLIARIEHEHFDYDRRARAFMSTPPGDWEARYEALEAKERPFESLPQLFIAV